MLTMSGAVEKLYEALPLPLGAFSLEKYLVFVAATIGISFLALYLIPSARGRGKEVFFEAAGTYGLGLLVGMTGIGAPIGVFMIFRSFWIASSR